MKQAITDNSINKRTFFSRDQVARENNLCGYLASAFAISMFAVGLGMPLSAQATTVGCSGSIGDSHGLIVAITNANDSASGGDTIDLGANCTYTFTAADNWWYGPNALPPIASDIVINGNGATLLATHTGDPIPITANAFRFFYVSGGMELRAGSLILNNLTLSGGYAKGGDSHYGGGGAGMGGAIFNQGQVNIASVNLVGNRAKGGNTFGAIPPVSLNNARDSGGGIGEDARFDNGGGFGGGFNSAFGGLGAVSNDSSSGGGGGFIFGANGALNTGMGGGLGGLGAGSSDGGDAGTSLSRGGVGGNFGGGGDRRDGPPARKFGGNSRGPDRGGFGGGFNAGANGGGGGGGFGGDRRDGAAREGFSYERKGGFNDRFAGQRNEGFAPRGDFAPRKEGFAPRNEGFAPRGDFAPRKEGFAPRNEGFAPRGDFAPRKPAFAKPGHAAPGNGGKVFVPRDAAKKRTAKPAR